MHIGLGIGPLSFGHWSMVIVSQFILPQKFGSKSIDLSLAILHGHESDSDSFDRNLG
jgi:hypothetical protein